METGTELFQTTEDDMENQSGRQLILNSRSRAEISGLEIDKDESGDDGEKERPKSLSRDRPISAVSIAKTSKISS